MAKPAKFSALETPHLKCRVWSHPWDGYIEVEKKGGKRVRYILHLECLRCEATRTDTVDPRTMDLVSRRYGHPTGYLISNVKSWGGRRTFNRNVLNELTTRLIKAA